MADIERIAPLAEGALPYNLAELQRQVGKSDIYNIIVEVNGMFTCTRICKIRIIHFKQIPNKVKHAVFIAIRIEMGRTIKYVSKPDIRCHIERWPVKI